MSKLHSVLFVLVTSGSLGACATNIKVPEIPIFDSPALAARREPDPPLPVRYVEVPTPLPLPGQLKPVGKEADKKKDARPPSERVTGANAAARVEPVKDGYIKGAQARRPAVISVNMFGSALAVNEFLARLHPYREEANHAHAAVTFSLASMELISDPEAGICPILSRSVGVGDSTPLLGLMELAKKKT